MGCDLFCKARAISVGFPRRISNEADEVWLEVGGMVGGGTGEYPSEPQTSSLQNEGGGGGLAGGKVLRDRLGDKGKKRGLEGGC